MELLHVDADDAPSDFWVPYVQSNPLERSAPIFLPIARRPSFFFGALTCFEAVLASFPTIPKDSACSNNQPLRILGDARPREDAICRLLPRSIESMCTSWPGRGSNSMLRSASLQNSRTHWSFLMLLDTYSLFMGQSPLHMVPDSSFIG